MSKLSSGHRETHNQAVRNSMTSCWVSIQVSYWGPRLERGGDYTLFCLHKLLIPVQLLMEMLLLTLPCKKLPPQNEIFKHIHSKSWLSHYNLFSGFIASSSITLETEWQSYFWNHPYKKSWSNYGVILMRIIWHDARGSLVIPSLKVTMKYSAYHLQLSWCCWRWLQPLTFDCSVD